MKYIAPLLILLSLPVGLEAQPPPAGGGGGGLSAVEDDTSPVLGGDLSVKGKKICDNDFDTCMELERTTDGDVIWLSSRGVDIVKGECDGVDCKWTINGDVNQAPLSPVFSIVDQAGGGKVDLQFYATGNPELDWAGVGKFLYLKNEGSVRWEMNQDHLRSPTGGGLFKTASATVPSLRPRASADSDTGIGSAGDDQLSLIAGGAEGLRVTASEGVFSGGVVPPQETANPCATYSEGAIFYNDTANYLCFCNQSGADRQAHDPTTACF